MICINFYSLDKIFLSHQRIQVNRLLFKLLSQVFQWQEFYNDFDLKNLFVSKTIPVAYYLIKMISMISSLLEWGLTFFFSLFFF